MRFIRKNGRIIPIREKSLTKQDAATGFAAGLASSLMFKRKSVVVGANLASAGQGISTTFHRFKLHKSKSTAFWEDTKSSFMKAGANIAGQATGLGALVVLNKLAKIRKIQKVAGVLK